MDVVVRSCLFLDDDLDYFTNLVCGVHNKGFLVYEVSVEFAQVLQGLFEEVLLEEFSVFAPAVNG